MSNRKPLDPECRADDRCTLEGHVIMRGGGHWKRERRHVDLTPGQVKTLAERTAGREAENKRRNPRLLSPAELDAELAEHIEAGNQDSARFAALVREHERRDK